MSYRVKRSMSRIGSVTVVLQWKRWWGWEWLGEWTGEHAEFAASQFMLKHDRLRKPIVAYGELHSGKFIEAKDDASACGCSPP